jgi:hypothetical protein
VKSLLKLFDMEFVIKSKSHGVLMFGQFVSYKKAEVEAKKLFPQLNDIYVVELEDYL